MRFRSNVDHRDAAIRQSIGIVTKRVRDDTGRAAESLAIIASYGSGVAVVSAALQKSPMIRHRVLFDEAFALLSSRAAAFLLEPKPQEKHSIQVAILLELVGEAFRAKGGTGALARHAKCNGYAKQCRDDRIFE